MHQFDDVINNPALSPAELDRLVICDLYPVVRRQLADVAEGRSARLDVEWVGRFAWLCRRHMANEAAS